MVIFEMKMKLTLRDIQKVVGHVYRKVMQRMYINYIPSD